MTISQAKNGIRYAVRNFGNAVGYCALSIKVGTRDEGAYSSGIAHFVEHTLFKGTLRHKSEWINNYLEQLGGELNAYTTREEIVLHATVLKDDMAKAASLLAEIAFEATFPENEIEIEKGVVIDEIASYKDSPSEDIYDVFEEKIFADSPLSRPILGTVESVQGISADELRRFRAQFFTPDRMSFTMVAPLPEKKMERIIERTFAKYPAIGNQLPQSDKPSDYNNIFDITIDKKNHEVNCIIGSTAPSLYDDTERRLATILLCNMLGGPASNSILGRILREKNGWVYNVDCSYSPYSDTGIVMIAFGCDKENLKGCGRVILRELRKLREKELSPQRLKAAKRQLLGQNAISRESGEAQCLSMCKNLAVFGNIPPQEELVSRLMTISPALVRQMAVEIFAEDKLSKLVYL